jgi:NTP pyrophosphatase (non-canonical NTP hydrolase)
MNLKEYQNEARRTAIYPDLGNNIFYPTLGLAGEAGEVANKVKKIMRDHQGILTDEYREFLKGELGDVMWYIASIASEAGLSLDEIAIKNIEKLDSRLKRGTIQGNGDNR